jgi:hypothetical protein
MRWVLLLVLGLSGCADFFENHAITECETMLKGRLKAPASYKRASVDGSGSNHDNGAWTIHYDAVNSFNAPIRGQGLCVIKDGKVSYSDFSAM